MRVDDHPAGNGLQPSRVLAVGDTQAILRAESRTAGVPVAAALAVRLFTTRGSAATTAHRVGKDCPSVGGAMPMFCARPPDGGGTGERPMPAALLERQAELDLLGASCTRATAGHGATALVVGEAGIGKTSLVKGFLATLPTGSRALVGACEDLLAPRALGALRDAVRSTPGPLLEAVTSDADLETVFVSAAEELASRSRPTVLVVEDAHWADGATLDVLRYLGRRVHDLPALIIVTYRDDALGWDHPLRSLLGGLAGAEAIRLPLQCLSARCGRTAGRSRGTWTAMPCSG